jgi:hypothetical protein
MRCQARLPRTLFGGRDRLGEPHGRMPPQLLQEQAHRLRRGRLLCAPQAKPGQRHLHQVDALQGRPRQDGGLQAGLIPTSMSQATK